MRTHAEGPQKVREVHVLQGRLRRHPLRPALKNGDLVSVGDPLLPLLPLEDQALVSVRGQFLLDFDGPAVTRAVDEEILVPQGSVPVGVYVRRYGLDDALPAIEAVW